MNDNDNTAYDTAITVLNQANSRLLDIIGTFDSDQDLERFVKDHLDSVANRYHSNAVSEKAWVQEKYTEARDRLVKLLEQGGAGEVYDSQVERASGWLFSLEARISAGTLVFEGVRDIYQEYTGETWVPYSARKGTGTPKGSSGAAWEAANKLSKLGIAVDGYVFDTKTA